MLAFAGPELALIFGLVAVAAAARLMFKSWQSQARARLSEWAERNGFEIVRAEPRFRSLGPFSSWTTGRSQAVYFVNLRPPGGVVRSCWVRCGTRFGGVWFSDKVDVEWEES